MTVLLVGSDVKRSRLNSGDSASRELVVYTPPPLKFTVNVPKLLAKVGSRIGGTKGAKQGAEPIRKKLRYVEMQM
ncbi:MAG: hypothetical protein KAR11_09135 [Phycisphaerae bacterium]|nr:hypothetical protein [Phycisphaerae bacterium]